MSSFPSNPYASLCDDFYFNTHIQTEMELPSSRETVLHYFEQLQRRYPKLGHFYQRQPGEFILEEDKSYGAYRWASVEQKRISSGIVNPNSLEEAMEQHQQILEMVPYQLSVSRLDCASISLVYGFDFHCNGNHNLVLAKTIGMPLALESMAARQGSFLMNFEPAIQISLDPMLQTHARVHFEPRTTLYEPRGTTENGQLLSAYVTITRFESLAPEESFTEELLRLHGLMRELLDNHIADPILRPLQNAIATR